MRHYIQMVPSLFICLCVLGHYAVTITLNLFLILLLGVNFKMIGKIIGKLWNLLPSFNFWPLDQLLLLFLIKLIH